MRIVAGMLRGRKVDAPPGSGTRPTTDRVREALFSSLYSLRGGFEGAVVLDAFAGSGALGLEALSRGAETAVFYERDPKAASVLAANIASCGLCGAQATLVRRDVMQAPPLDQEKPFDLVLLDPPYDYDPDEVMSLVTKLRDGGVLADDAIVVYEHDLKSDAAVEATASASGFDRKAKKYGKTGVSIMTLRVE